MFNAGAWAGSIARADGKVPRLQVSQEKWDCTKMQLLELKGMLENNAFKLPRVRLMQISRYLLYVTRTYKHLTPYLKG